jgi:Response regulators consisting of a CheY-like receiver domain and a winged-helix DNA-binding domain
MNSRDEPITILLVEDSDDDAFFFGWTLQKTGLNCRCEHVVDGRQAIDFLEQARRQGQLPASVFVDLKLPGMSGFEILEWIKNQKFDPELDVSVLSGSDHDVDVRRARELGARHYLVKPITCEQFVLRLSHVARRHVLQDSSKASAE